VTVQPNAASGLSPGTYSGTVTISGSSDAFGNNPVAGSPKTVNYTYTVPSDLTATPTSLTFDYVNGGAAPSTQALNFSDSGGNSYSWSAQILYTSGSNWLQLNGGSTASGASLPGSMTVGVQSPGSLGTYNATIRITGGGKTLDVPVSLTFRSPSISVSPSSMAFTTTAGTTGSLTAQTATISGSNIAWTASANQSWVQLSKTSGTGPDTFTVNANVTGLASGTYNATVTVADTIGGTPSTIAVTLYAQPRRLRVSDDGVALVSAGTTSRLSHTIQVTENLGSAITWNASESETWLTVTAGGTTPGSLTINADPTGLTPEQIYTTTVTVTSPDTANTETVKVGFYVSASTPSASQTVTISSIYANVIADPIRPYVYITNEFACSAGTNGNNTIGIYNVYTGASVGTMTGQSGAALSEMAVSSDGSTLFVLDSATGEIDTFNLDTQAAGAVIDPLGSSALTGCAGLSYARINGRAFLLTSARHIIDVQTATSPGNFTQPVGATSLKLIAASGDGSSLYAIDFDGNLRRYSMTHDSLLSQTSVTRTHLVTKNLSLAETDLAVNASGSRVYVSDPVSASTGIYTFDGTTLNSTPTLPGSGFNGNVEVGPTGKLYTGEGITGGSATDLWVYDEFGTSAGTHNLPFLSFDRQLVLSGDGVRIVELGFVPSGGGEATQTQLGFVTTTP